MHDHLKTLGSGKTQYTFNEPDYALLEWFDSPFHKDVKGTVHIEVPEFTSLCPKTGQPDFATIIIDYEPKERCVESKSLKLYMMSFRMFGEFHEACVDRIANDLIELLHPRWIKVVGQFTPRGGIPFWPTVEWSE